MIDPSESTPPPDWAIEHARAAVKIGMHVPEIEKLLVSRGLAPEAATAVVEQVLSDQVGQVLRSEKRAFRRKLVNRILSALTGCAYVLTGYLVGGGAVALRASLFVLFPLACIWFGDEIGSRTGLTGRMYITSPTPGVFVRIAGWLLLLLPVIILVVLALIHA